MGNFLTKTMKNVAVNSAKDAATSAARTMVVGATANMISKTLGLDDSLVGRVLMVGVPMMMFAGSEDPGIAGRLFDNSKKKDKKKRRKNRTEAEREYFSVFGDKAHEMTKAIAGETGAAEDEVNGIMSLFLPELEDAIAQEELADQGAMRKLFKRETEDAKKQSPSFAKMAMKVAF